MKGSTILTTLAHNLRVGRKRRGQAKSLFPIKKHPLPPSDCFGQFDQFAQFGQFGQFGQSDRPLQFL